MSKALALDLLGRLVLGLGLLYYATPSKWRWSAGHEVIRWALMLAVVALAIEAVDAT